MNADVMLHKLFNSYIKANDQKWIKHVASLVNHRRFLYSMIFPECQLNCDYEVTGTSLLKADKKTAKLMCGVCSKLTFFFPMLPFDLTKNIKKSNISYPLIRTLFRALNTSIILLYFFIVDFYFYSSHFGVSCI